MKVFVSWSGERSQLLAQALREWLPLVLHYVEPWLSQQDIEAGERWALEISKELETSNFGIVCITKNNIASPWILFEAGALAKSMQQGRVMPLLLDIDFKDITGPLAQFQAKKVDKQGLNELISSINKLANQPVDSRLQQLFEVFWPKLEEKVGQIPAEAASTKSHRPQHEILEELVSGVRNLELRFRDSMDDRTRVRQKKSNLHPMMFEELFYHNRRDPVRFMLVSSFLRDDFPWLYELGVDAYRASLDDSQPRRRQEAVHRFLQALKMLRHGPFLEESRLDKRTYSMVRDLEHMLIAEDTQADFGSPNTDEVKVVD